MAMIWLAAIWQMWAASEGWEFTVRGTCRLERRDRVVSVLDAVSREPVAGLELEIWIHGVRKKVVVTNASGEVQIREDGLVGIRHPGSALYVPCKMVAWFAARKRPRRLPLQALLCVVAFVFLLIAAYPAGRAAIKRMEKKRMPPVPEEAPEVEFSPSSSRSFIPWKKAGYHGQVQVWESGLPLADVMISYEIDGLSASVFTDAEGRFHLPAQTRFARFEKPGFQTVQVPQMRGAVVVRLMSLPVRALWLLRQICRRHDPKRYAKLSPRQALAERIPPPEWIQRLELLAYGGVVPENGEIEKLEHMLENPENDLEPPGSG